MREIRFSLAEPIHATICHGSIVLGACNGDKQPCRLKAEDIDIRQSEGANSQLESILM
jgi:hypothetical protein